ncbi:hypothetical protein ACFXQA_10320 [Microbacterium sp. P07]|uniref:hypothetical protein n=1 Tax=Microbacterium sp. P07 TaxID=3366952 RepID=UPI003745248C
MAGVAGEVGEAEFAENVEDISAKQTDMSDGINSCIEKFNNYDWGCMADDETKEKVGAAVDQMKETWDELSDQLLQLASPGNPFWFKEAAESWLSVRSNLSGQLVFLQDASSSSLPASESWVGTEGAVYRDMPGVQASAISGVVDYAGSYAEHLSLHGQQIIDLWVDLSMKFIDYAQLVATSVANFLTADPTKWLDIVSEIVDTVSNLIDFVQEIIELVATTWSETKNQMASLEIQLADLSGSVAGQWPTIELLS